MKLSEEIRMMEEWEALASKLEAENEESLELLVEARDLILRLRSKAGQAGMWEIILGRMDALLTDDAS